MAVEEILFIIKSDIESAGVITGRSDISVSDGKDAANTNACSPWRVNRAKKQLDLGFYLLLEIGSVV